MNEPLQLPGNPPRSEAQKKDLKRLEEFQVKLQKFCEENLLPTDEFFFQGRTDTAMTIQFGAGCPACAIIRTLQWGIECQVKHEDGRPFALPASEDIKHIVEQSVQEVLNDMLDTDKSTKH